MEGRGESMKFLSYKYKGQTSFGWTEDEENVYDLKKIHNEAYSSLKDYIASKEWGETLDKTEAIPMEDIQLLPVIPNPDKIICAGVNYDEHRLETKRETLAHPIIFLRVAESQVAHEADVILPKNSMKLDYEGEMAIVIGKEGRHISKEDSWEYIAGYSVYNDVSVRDWQLHTSQWGPGKNFDGTGAFGPYLIPRSAIQDGENLKLQTRLNGEVVQSSETDLLLFTIPELIEYISGFTTLRPGDVIATGTPGGVGLKRNPPLFMKAGDVVEVEVEKIGLLRNPIVAESE